MEITVKNNYVRISARKVRPVMHGLRGMAAEEAKKVLFFTQRKAATLLYALVNSGIAAAKENFLETDQIFIKSVCCNEAPSLKRMQPWSKGQSRAITKRGSHLILTLESRETPKALADKKPAKKAVKTVKSAKAIKEIVKG
ncbi:MAG: 50S ribosomal protein L22 [Candidatus Berkelbacteria bacterium]